MAQITGGELVVRTLVRAHVKQVFGLHGAHLETIFQSCRQHGISLLDTRHEVAAGHAAEGYARATRSLGVAMITAGPGFTNVITSLANAYLDRTSVLYLSGSAALRDAETNTLQAGIDQVSVARPIAKWAHQITTVQQIPRLVSQAVRLATSPPTGPVLLDLPIDVLTATVEEDSVRIPDDVLVEAPTAPNAGAIAATAALLGAAKRPVILVGPGAWQSDAGAALRAFAERARIPVYSDFQSHGLLPSDHPCYGGTYHKMSDLATPETRPDVVLALGVRFGLFTLGMSDRLVPLAARLIHVDADPKEIGRLREVTVPIVADSRETLLALDAHTKQTKWPDWNPWLKVIQDAKAARRERASKDLARTAPPIHPYQLVTALVENLPADCTIVGDGAETYHWLNEVIAQKRAGTYITHGFLGAVGFGLGLSLGAQVAQPGKPVLCLVGDGAIGFTIAELDTMARHGLPIVVVIMNNRSWAASQHFQEIVSGRENVIGTTLGGAKYHDVATAFGARGVHVKEIAALAPAIREAFASGKPTCINVEVDVAPFPPELLLLMERH